MGHRFPLNIAPPACLLQENYFGGYQTIQPTSGASRRFESHFDVETPETCRVVVDEAPTRGLDVDVALEIGRVEAILPKVRSCSVLY